MLPIFLYGTLRHIPLLEIVLGRRAADISMSQAVLPNAEVLRVKNAAFPQLVLGQGSGFEGLLLETPTNADRARLDFYEGPFGYGLTTVTLADGRKAETFLPGASVAEADGPWQLAEWEADWADFACHGAREVMTYFGSRTPQELARMWRAIETRAWSKVNAQKTRYAGAGFRGRIDMQSRKIRYSDFFAMEDFELSFERFDGTMSAPLRRAAFLGMDAAIVLPYDPVRDRVLLVEQLRMGPVGRGDPDAWQLEPVAGHVDAGETPQQAALREMREEAGVEAHDLIPVAESYASPGASSEFFFVYVAIADLPDEVAGTAGIEAEGENIRSHLMGFDDLMEMLEDRRAANGPLVMAGYWLAHHRTRLRQGA